MATRRLSMQNARGFPGMVRRFRGIGKGRKTRRALRARRHRAGAATDETLARWPRVRITPMFGRWGYFVGETLLRASRCREGARSVDPASPRRSAATRSPTPGCARTAASRAKCGSSSDVEGSRTWGGRCAGSGAATRPRRAGRPPSGDRGLGAGAASRVRSACSRALASIRSNLTSGMRPR